MAATVRDDSISRSIMFLCLGASAVLLIIQWRAWAAGGGMGQPRSVEPTSAKKSAVAQVQSQPQPLPAPTKLSPAALPVEKPSVQVPSEAPAGSINLAVDLSDRRVYLYQGKTQLTSYPLAVGKDGWETPTGTFKVMEMQQNPGWLHPITKEVIAPGPNNPLGKRWIGFLIEGQTHIGFHGTNEERLIGQAVSHGCLRMRNKDVIALYEKVKMGTVVTVRL
jgi:lipoprotein-anchoring transpeptidase ErfK/SrfK